ncbi:hypothetical protein GCM10020000_61400 [Streptomyces olivoverticillatus]
MAAYGADVGAGAADVAAQEQEVDDFLDGGDGVFVLGEAHGPADDGAPGGEDHAQRGFDLFAAQSGGAQGLVPVGGAGGALEVGVAVGVLGDEGGVDGAFGFEDEAVEEAEEGLVAAEADLEEEVGEGGAAAAEAADVLGGFLKRSRPASGSGLTVMIFVPLGFGLFQGAEHAGVVGAGVLSGDDDQVGLVEVLQQDAALADADGLGECGAGGLVAHVGAVGEVVGAEFAGEELVEEGCFVAGAAGGVEDGLVGGW